MSRILVVDCNCVCHRAKHTLDKLTAEGQKVGIIFGFLETILRLAKVHETNRFVFCWDSKKNFRKEIYPSYKMKRHKDKTPEQYAIDELAYPQFNFIRQKVLPALGFTNNFIQTGYESDDLIARFVMDYPGHIIVSNDGDLLQLLTFADMWNISTRRMVTEDSFVEEYGIPSILWSDVKAYAGCSTDEVEGIDDIGEKSAIAFINNTLKLTSTRYKKLVSDQGKAIYERNKALVTLPFEGTDPIEYDPNSRFDMMGFIALCRQLDFQSFLRKDALSEWREHLED